MLRNPMFSLIAVLFSSFTAFASDCHFVRPSANRIELSLNGVKISLVGWTHFSKQETPNKPKPCWDQAVLAAQNKSCAAAATALRQIPVQLPEKSAKNAKQAVQDLQDARQDNTFQKLGIEASPAEMFIIKLQQDLFCHARCGLHSWARHARKSGADLP